MNNIKTVGKKMHYTFSQIPDNAISDERVSDKDEEVSLKQLTVCVANDQVANDVHQDHNISIPNDQHEDSAKEDMSSISIEEIDIESGQFIE